MMTIFFVYSFLAFSLGDQRYRKSTFAKDALLSNYYYNEAFINEYKGESAAMCGQFCINFNCFSFTYDLVKGTCRIHNRRMTNPHNGLEAENTTYYYGEDAKDCSEIDASGFFTIYPQPATALDVFCNKGWTVIQNRFDGSVNFYRGWNDYKHFFGNKDGEYWLGHENIRMLTSLGLKQLRIDLTTADNLSYQATYMSFSIEDEINNYRLHVQQYSGDAGDSLSFHDGMPFSTFDRDNDGTSINCAGTYTGAWWYGKRPGTKCFHSTLNALYGASNWSRMIWYGITADVDIAKTSMKIRRP